MQGRIGDISTMQQRKRCGNPSSDRSQAYIASVSAVNVRVCSRAVLRENRQSMVLICLRIDVVHTASVVVVYVVSRLECDAPRGDASIPSSFCSRAVKPHF